jgi:hypothetical protein
MAAALLDLAVADADVDVEAFEVTGIDISRPPDLTYPIDERIEESNVGERGQFINDAIQHPRLICPGSKDCNSFLEGRG